MVAVIRLISFAMFILRVSYMLAPLVERLMEQLREFIVAARSKRLAPVDPPMPWPVRGDHQAPWQVFNDSMVDDGDVWRSDDAERG